MPTPIKAGPTNASAPGRASAPAAGPGVLATVACAWFVPGGGHFLHGQARKGAIFAVVLFAMFAIGIASRGRLFPFDTSEPLVLLAAASEWMMGLPRLAAAIGGWGAGQVTAISYEYGNTFLITAGLLNVLVTFDAFDRATGRKAR